MRPYSADIRLLRAALCQGTRLSGIFVDAHMLRMMPKALGELRADVPDDREVFLDPVTHKIDREPFRKKPKSFGRLPYFLVDKLGTRAPTTAELERYSPEIARSVLNLQREYGVASFLTPSLYVRPDAFVNNSCATTFSVGRRWASDLMAMAAGRPVTLSMCIDVECLRAVATLRKIEAFVREYRAATVYLTLGDFDLGQNPELDRGVFDFLRTLRENGATRIIYSRAPLWMYFLAPHGVTDVVTGVNFQSIFRLEDLEREDDIDGIVHNYYVPHRFCRMTSEQAAEALERGIIDACGCSVCKGAVPTRSSEIREHYIHARQQECAELQTAADKTAILNRWLDEAEVFVARVKDRGLRVLGDPTPTLWRRALAG